MTGKSSYQPQGNSGYGAVPGMGNYGSGMGGGFAAPNNPNMRLNSNPWAVPGSSPVAGGMSGGGGYGAGPNNPNLRLISNPWAAPGSAPVGPSAPGGPYGGAITNGQMSTPDPGMGARLFGDPGNQMGTQSQFGPLPFASGYGSHIPTMAENGAAGPGWSMDQNASYQNSLKGAQAQTAYRMANPNQFDAQGNANWQDPQWRLNTLRMQGKI